MEKIGLRKAMFGAGAWLEENKKWLKFPQLTHKMESSAATLCNSAIQAMLEKKKRAPTCRGRDA